MIPVFYRKSAKTTVVLAPMSALDALRPLGPWLAWRQDDVAILFQGRSDWSLLPWDFKGGHRPGALLAENRCWQCLVSDECEGAGGREERVPELVQIGRKTDWSSKMEDSIEIGFRRNCITNPHTDEIEVPRQPKIGRRLEEAGFRLVRTIGAFAEGGLLAYAKTPAPPSLHANNGRWRDRRKQADMTFDDAQVLRNLAEFKVKGEQAQGQKMALKAFRDAQCSKCVYKCGRPPWSWETRSFKEGKCYLALEEVDTGYTGTREQKLWIAAHRIAGYDLKVCGERSTRPAAGVGQWPDDKDPGQMVIARRRAGAGFLAKLPIARYLELAGKEPVTEDELIEEHVIEERAALTYWALKRIHEHCRGHARFSKGDRFVYNDTFYVEMRDSKYIVIGSDSRASQHGGYGSRGRTITADERPRFRTHYEYPYFTNIQNILGVTPGARR